MAAVVLRRCVKCHVWTVPANRYRRHAWLRERYASYGGRGLCHGCRAHAEYSGTLIDFERKAVTRDELLDEWTLLRQQGYTIPQAAPRLGMTSEAMGRALARAKHDGDSRAIFTYQGTHRARREQASA